MKISKLFHWLYALVMLLPIFAIGSTILVNTFNKEVKQPTQEVEITYLYESNDVNSFADLQPYNIYHLDELDFANFELSRVNGYVYMELNLVNCEYFTFEQLDGPYLDELYIDGYNSNYGNYINLQITLYQDNIEITHINCSNEAGYVGFADIMNSADGTIILYNFDFFVFDAIQLQNLDRYYFDPMGILPSKSDFNVIDEVEIIEHETTINDIFYYSVDKVMSSPMFNWSMSSFLVTPFTYIATLFGMPTNSVFMLLLSYWLDISIIWLVFDLVMYVPLLVHRWLDKGVIE